MIDRSSADKANFLPFRKRRYDLQQSPNDEHTEAQAEPPQNGGSPKDDSIHTAMNPSHQKVEEDTATIMASMMNATLPSPTSSPPSPLTKHDIQNGVKIKPEIPKSIRMNGSGRPGPKTNMPLPKKKKVILQYMSPSKHVKPIEEEEDDATDSSDDDEDDGKIYCICRQPYNPNLWMIACDVCNDWYHGKCVQITATQARKIKVYVCPSCSQRTGQLIQYKTPKKRKFENDSRSNSPHRSPNSSPHNSTEANVILHGATDTDMSNTPPTDNDHEKPTKRKKVVTDGTLLYNALTPSYMGGDIKI
jgi:hypothetical protein